MQISQNSELKNILMPLIQQLILNRPKDVLKFIKQYSSKQIDSRRIPKATKILHLNAISSEYANIRQNMKKPSKTQIFQKIQKQNHQGIVFAKNLSQVNFLKSVLLNIQLFKRIKQKTLEELINLIQIRKTMKNQIILEEGEECTAMYIVKSGQLMSYKRQNNKKVIINLYKKGQYFIQQFLIYKSLSDFYLQSKEQSELYCLSRRNLQCVMYGIKMPNKQKWSQILNKLSFLRGVPYKQINLLSEIAKLQGFSSSKKIFRCKKNINKFYIILKGKVEAILLNSNGIEQQQKIYEQGQYFAKLALLGTCVSKYCLRSLTPCVFLCIEGAKFRRVVGYLPHLKQGKQTSFKIKENTKNFQKQQINDNLVDHKSPKQR